MADPDKKTGDLRSTTSPVPTDDASNQALSEALNSSFLLIKLLGVAMLAALVFSCYFTVNPNEVAVILRFGSPVGTGREVIRTNGLYFRLPSPIDEVVRIKVGELQTVVATNAWFGVSADGDGAKPAPMPQLNPAIDGHVITSDGNIMHVKATMKYRVTDPLAYTFRFANITNLIVNALNNSVQWAGVRFKADDLIYKNPAGFRLAIRDRVVSVCDRAGYGIVVDNVDVNQTAPGAVKDAFDQVQSADQEKDKKIKEAQGEYERITREAGGTTNRIIAEARSGAEALVQGVEADVRFFQDQLPAYRKNEALFRRLRLTEVTSTILTNSQRKFFLPRRGDGVPRELRLNLNPEPDEPPKSANAR
ncbi:MAG TPA: protease modulator HflK [Candidatus Limnocylindria bacterium]|jgi:membrane protease subunit HflK|nr:protease modulator HflK [Candidatus Limnocylindria bacterium]